MKKEVVNGCYYNDVIKVGDFVRIAGGIIAQVTNKNKDGILIDRVIRDPMRQDGTIRDWCIFNDEKRLIVKHSPNIIDLIEIRRLYKWRTSSRERQ